MSEEENNSNEVLDKLTPEEMLELQSFLKGNISAPAPAENYSIHKFLSDISLSKDTTKTGYLDASEIGIPDLPTRSLKELALFSRDIWGQPLFADYFAAKAEIITSTSLSKDAKLIELAVVARRELGDITKRNRKPNKGWFSKKEDKEQ